MIRASYVDICNGNIVAAALIHIFEQWHLVKVKNRDQYRKNKDSDASLSAVVEGLYQWHTTADLEGQLMGLAKRDSIQMARVQLVSMGIISEHRNPNPKYAFDKTTFFIFHPDAVETYIDAKQRLRNSDNSQPAPDIRTSSTENRARSADDRQNTYTTSIDDDKYHNKDIPAADASGAKNTAKKRDRKKAKAPGAEPDTDWQRWVDRYEEHVKKWNGGLGHRWAPVQLGPQGLKGIRQHLVQISTKLEGKSDDDCGYGAWCYILDNWESLGDEWLAGQFDLTVLLKKITEILNRLRNATNKNRGINTGNGRGNGTSADRVAAVADY